MPTSQELFSLIWRIADDLRFEIKEADNEDIILPFTLLRRLDCVLEPTREKVRERERDYTKKAKPDVLKQLLMDAAGVPYYNRSPYSFQELLRDAAAIKLNFGVWLEGFSDNIKDILYNFSGGEEKGLGPIYETLARKNLLYTITKKFASVDLHPSAVDNHTMGLVYEHLIRKFKEGAAAGQQYTPRDIVKLLVRLVFADAESGLKRGKGNLVGIYDPACGTGGMLTVAKEYLVNELNLPSSNVFTYGQEILEHTYAIAKADTLMKGDDAGNIKQGNTLTDDQLAGKQFNFMMANPEFGTKWEKFADVIRAEAGLGESGRFSAGLPDVDDGSFLFLQHMISKMTAPEQGGSVIGIVFNGSPLFNGDAGSGWSNIRKWIIQNDWLDAIVALTEDMFYNTNIATYLWIVRNNKPKHRRGRIVLVNGNQDRFRTLMRRNLGKKRVELTAETIEELVGAYKAAQPVPKLVQTFDLQDFGFTRVQVERPLRLRYDLKPEQVAAFRESKFFLDLATSKKAGDKAKAEVDAGKQKQAHLVAALADVAKMCPCRDDRAFLNALNDALPFKLTGQLIKAVRSAFGERDEEAAKVLQRPFENVAAKEADADPSTFYETDSELRDQERIPLKQDIDDYFEREVLPYAPDAWMERGKDQVGYEISFTKYFYEYVPPRPLAAILADLEALDAEAEKLQAELRA